MTADSISNAIENWASRKKLTNIDVRHGTPSARESAEDYEIVREYSYYPGSVDKAALELWITSEGAVAVGIERWDRIAGRAGLRTTLARFAGGFEPRFLELQEVLHICNIVANGDIEITALGFLGKLVSCDLTPRADSETSNLSRIDPFLRTLSATGIVSRTKLPYKNWDAMD